MQLTEKVCGTPSRNLNSMSLEFICPVCKTPVAKNAAGRFECQRCCIEFQSTNGIPRFEGRTIAGNKKEEVFRFWNTAPNESKSVDVPLNTSEFFAQTEYKRYHQLHQNLGTPFFKDAIGFDRYSGKKILEVGCGIGIDSIQFARAKNDLTLLDLTIESLSITRARLESEGYTANYVCGDSENLPFSDGQFDVVYSYGVIHHSPDTAQSVREILRVLKPGGEAIVMLYNYYSAMVFCQVLVNQGFRLGYFFKYWSLQELLNRRTELQSATDNNVPVLTQAFSRRQVRKMFKGFRDVAISTHYLTPGMLAQFRYLLKVIPKSIKSKLPGLIGWNHIIKARKP